MKTYTSRGYVLGVRCGKNHSGNTRYAVDGSWAACQGCGNFVDAASLGFASRTEALSAEAAIIGRPSYPDGPAAASVAWLVQR